MSLWSLKSKFNSDKSFISQDSKFFKSGCQINDTGTKPFPKRPQFHKFNMPVINYRPNWHFKFKTLYPRIPNHWFETPYSTLVWAALWNFQGQAWAGWELSILSWMVLLRPLRLLQRLDEPLSILLHKHTLCTKTDRGSTQNW